MRLIVDGFRLVAEIVECGNKRYQLIVFPYGHSQCWLENKIFTSQENAIEYVNHNKDFYITEWNRIDFEVYRHLRAACDEICHRHF